MQRRFMLALQARLSADPDVSPSYEELMQDLGVKSKAVISRLVKGCEDRGRIGRLPGRSRSIEILVPVSEDEVTVQDDLIKSFSDGELVRELVDRGVLAFSPQFLRV